MFCSYNNNTIGKPLPTQEQRKLDTAEWRMYNEACAKFFDSLLLKSGRFSGGILVAKNGQVLYEYYGGYSDEAGVEPVGPDTRFHVASTSKTFTSIALMQQVQAGKVHLDDSIQVYFPLFPYHGITVRNLLNHSSGLPNYAHLFPSYKWDEQRTATNTDVLYLFYANRPNLEFAPGKKFRYSNTNFALLALIVEKASGQFFPKYVADSIFAKAGMQNSFVLSYQNPGNYMPSWDGGGRVYPFNFLDAIYGDKNVYTTCRDLLKYDSAISSGALLKQQWLDTAWTPNFMDRHYGDTLEYYGLGWRLKVFSDSLKISYHNGWWHGNNAVFHHIPADSAVIIVTGNRMNNRIYQAGKAANLFRPYYKKFIAESEVEERPAPKKRTPVVNKKRSVSSKPRSTKSKR